MTPEQEKQFNDFGCACRCLIFLSNGRGNPITKEQFIDQFSKDYPWWREENKFGLTDTGMIFDIARKLDLTTSFQIFIDPDIVRKKIRAKETGAVLFFSEKKEEASIDGQKTFSWYFHCGIMKLTPIEDDKVHCFWVDNNMKVAYSKSLLDSELNSIGGYFALFS